MCIYLFVCIDKTRSPSTESVVYKIYWIHRAKDAFVSQLELFRLLGTSFIFADS